MASGSYRKRTIPQEPERTIISHRATSQLPVVKDTEEPTIIRPFPAEPHLRKQKNPTTRPYSVAPRFMNNVVDEFEDSPLKRHVPWMRPFVILMSVIIVAVLVLVAAGAFQRISDNPNLVIPLGAQTFPIEVGGTYGAVNTWTNSNGPIGQQVPIPTHAGPYGVLGKPTLTVDFMNQVLAYYNSPAAGKAQALYDDGIKYGIDPAFALAFFMHESTFGTAGWATPHLSLGNIRCVPEYTCDHGYSQYSSWEQGFEAWYKLIRNLYVAQWGLVTVDQIIPRYAPTADHNNESAYIGSLKHALDTWHAGVIQVR
ncbi:MAG: glucosaminidase domain-containing protein [Chloroflexota bacterium]|nr:glucosaminidase domain-containing protein [Chloroflexota bacterium]